MDGKGDFSGSAPGQGRHESYGGAKHDNAPGAWKQGNLVYGVPVFPETSFAFAAKQKILDVRGGNKLG